MPKYEQSVTLNVNPNFANMLNTITTMVEECKGRKWMYDHITESVDNAELALAKHLTEDMGPELVSRFARLGMMLVWEAMEDKQQSFKRN